MTTTRLSNHGGYVVMTPGREKTTSGKGVPRIQRGRPEGPTNLCMTTYAPRAQSPCDRAEYRIDSHSNRRRPEVGE